MMDGGSSRSFVWVSTRAISSASVVAASGNYHGERAPEDAAITGLVLNR